MTIAILMGIGIAAGTLAGVFGVGGGVLIVPALTFFLSYSQVSATGTSLIALLAPVGLGGVMAFYSAGKIGPEHIKAGLLISLGMFVGTFFGAKIALNLPAHVLKRSFSVFLVILAIRLWFTAAPK